MDTSSWMGVARPRQVSVEGRRRRHPQEGEGGDAHSGPATVGRWTIRPENDPGYASRSDLLSLEKGGFSCTG